jgi:glycosyltransferase involved in cell wall biosynthesis
MKILLSLYACEPNRGSEPGVGWAWALGMSKRLNTYCLTRANNKEIIEKELQNLGYEKLDSEENGVDKYHNKNDGTTLRFIFTDLPKWILKLKQKHILPTSIYYLMWQFKARNYFDSLNLIVDIIHHVTFCSFTLPGVWWNRKEKVILGPLGGTSTTRQCFLQLYPFFKRLKESFRTLYVKSWKFNWFCTKSLKSADFLFLIQKDFFNLANSKKFNIPNLTLFDVHVPDKLLNCELNPTRERNNQFIWAGVHEPIKGFNVAAKAYKYAFSGQLESAPIMKIYGAGSQTKKMKKLISKLNLESKLIFCGKAQQQELWNEISKSKAFIFTSVRDTFGCVALEAMACGTPIICFNHQGIGQITNETNAIKIEPTTWKNAIKDFSKAMQKIYNDDNLVNKLGQNARNYVINNHTLNKKFDLVESIYTSLLTSN